MLKHCCSCRSQEWEHSTVRWLTRDYQSNSPCLCVLPFANSMLSNNCVQLAKAKYLLHMPRILSQVLVMIEDHKLHCAAQLRRVNINIALISWWMEDTCITVLQCTYMIHIICNTDSGTCLPTWYFMSSCFLEVCSGFCSDSDSDDFISSISASELLEELEPADGAELILNFDFWENHKTTQSYV